MAEFQEVIRQARRMCKESDSCGFCPVGGKEIQCDIACRVARKDCTDKIMEEFEQTVEEWAADHPEPQYPTWKEWITETFTGVAAPPSPCQFMRTKDWEKAANVMCELVRCESCREKPIPAEIAEKLGIKPKDGK